MKMKDTLQMPFTEFAMKANLNTKEPLIQKEWIENNIYEQIIKKNEGNPTYIFQDGPPYANGDLHMGHALNKTLKDITLRYKNMSGYQSKVIWGWDTHGLPIENALLKKKKINRKELSDSEFRKLCEEYAEVQIAKQKEQFMTLGILEGEKRIYKTLDKDYESEQIKIFAKMVEKGLIYKGLKPVYWSYSSQSALADAEIEYKDVESYSVYVSIDVVDEKFDNTKVIIWTTTPWTLPVNNGVCLNPKLTYSFVKTSDTTYIITKNLVEDVCKACNISEYKIIKEVLGSELEKIKLSHPINDDVNTFIMLGEHVTDDAGTGCVHTSPGHGEDDYKVGLEYGLEPVSVIDAYGKMNSNAKKYETMFYEAANDDIVADLEHKKSLLSCNKFTHSSPHDWRTKKPVVYRATEQWFATITPVKEEMLKSVDNVEYVNEWAKKRLYNMIESRDEWCISRQRLWGVPIPIFYTQDDEPILDQEVITHVANLFEEHGSNIWFEKEAIDLLPKGYKNDKSPDGIFRKEKDIMDVWFDSGSAAIAVSKKRLNAYPADLFLEGSDQYRGWFNSSLILGHIIEEQSPFKKLVSHGFVLDGKGIKMSKSIGNIIAPSKITNTRGADIIRLWTASTDYQSDVRISEEILNQVSEVYRRYRNTIKFILGNLHDFDKSMLVDTNELTKFDKYAVNRLNELNNSVIDAYDNFEFKKVTDLINNYITTELSAFYLDYIKDITYITKADDVRRRHVQTVLYMHAEKLISLMAPIIPHTSYEAYKLFEENNVFMVDIKKVEVDNNEELMKYAKDFLEFRKVVNKEIEQLRDEKVIGKSFEAKLHITASNYGKKIFDYFKDLDLYFIVSKVEITVDESIDDSEVGTLKVAKYEGIECQRCRKYFIDDEINLIQMDDNDTNVCVNCKEIIDEVC